MSTASRPNLIVAAAAAAVVLVASPVSSLLMSDQQHHHNHHVARQTPLGRPSFVQLNASTNQPKFTELEKLKAKRLSIRRRRDVDVEASSATSRHDGVHPENERTSSSSEHSTTIGLEYLYEAGEERHSDDLFHIILMPSSFQKDHMSIEYVAESCSEILGIRADKAYDLSLFAKHQGFSTLGTWTREECLSMGEQLLSSNLDCRVIPFNGGVVDPESNKRLPPSEYAGDSNIMLTTSRPSGAIDTYYLV